MAKKTEPKKPRPSEPGMPITEMDEKETKLNKEGIHVVKSVTINQPPETIYRFWRNFENLPRFMDHLESVTVIDERYSHWVAKGPLGKRVEWDAEIVNETPNQVIGWRSVEKADVDNAGSVNFEPAPGGRGTEVKVTLRYVPPAGAIGAAFAKLFGEEPSVQVEDDLNNLKRLLEAGELPTTEGQSRGGLATREREQFEERSTVAAYRQGADDRTGAMGHDDM
jgi:uncharacterized membrane protein